MFSSAPNILIAAILVELLLAGGLWASLNHQDVSPDSEPIESHRFLESEPRDLFRDRLKSRGVAFSESNSGTFMFSKPSDPRISASIDDVMDAYYPPRGSASPDKVKVEQWQSLLLQNGIGTRSFRRGGEHWISWSEDDDRLVRQLIDQLEAGAAKEPALVQSE